MPRRKNKREYIINNVLACRMWDYAKNEKENLNPSYISCGSKKYAYFICPICSKFWCGIIRDAIRQEKCPECRKKENIENRRKNRKRAKNALAIIINNTPAAMRYKITVWQQYFFTKGTEKV